MTPGEMALVRKNLGLSNDCKECKWYRERFEDGRKPYEPMCILGQAHYDWAWLGETWGNYARLAREGRSCGPHGIYWEPGE